MSRLLIVPMNGKSFGATVTGADIMSLTDTEFATVHDALIQHGFLLFPEQHLNEENSADFGRRFGDLEFGGQPMSNQKKHSDGSLGEIYDLQSQLMRTNVGNETWHTDSTYKPISSKVAMLSAVVVPEFDGQTELADLRAGYDALDDETKERIAGLSAFHSTNYSQANDIGDFPDKDKEWLYGEVYHGEAYLRPLIKVHPETGEPNLFVGRHAFSVPGLERNESRSLLASLLDHVTSDESRVYSHNWEPGDTLLWDNRCILHRARPYDYSKPRHLIATRVAGDPATELAYYPEDPEAETGRAVLTAELEILRSETTRHRYGASTATSLGGTKEEWRSLASKD